MHENSCTLKAPRLAEGIATLGVPHSRRHRWVPAQAKARLSDDSGGASRVAKRFGVDASMGCPQIVFAGNGTRLYEGFDALARPNRQRFEGWLWPKLRTQVMFVNRVSRPRGRVPSRRRPPCPRDDASRRS